MPTELPRIEGGIPEKDWGFGETIAAPNEPVLLPPSEEEEEKGLAPSAAPKAASGSKAPAEPKARNFEDAMAVIARRRRLRQQPGALGMEQLKAIGQGGVSGGVRTSPMIVGAMGGAKYGAPLGLKGMLAGFILGGAAGYIAGDVAGDKLESMGIAKDPADMPMHLRPYGYAGEAFGGGFGFAGTVPRLAQTGARVPDSLIGRQVNKMLDLAADKPIQFLIAETAALLTAAGAEGVWEAYRPGRPMERMTAGMAGGIFNPTRIFTWGGRTAYEIGRFFVKRMSHDSKLSEAGRLLAKALESEDPDVMMQLLAETEEIAKTIPGFRGTAGQTTGHLGLAQVEAELAERSRPFYGDISERAQQSLEAIANQMILIEKSGDPHAMQAVAELMRVRVNMALERAVNLAQLEALAAIEKIGPTVAAGERATLSREAVLAATERAMDLVDPIRKSLWNQAFPDPSAPAQWKTIFQAVARLQGEAADIKLPSTLTSFLEEISGALRIIELAEQGIKELPNGTPITTRMVKAAQKKTSVEKLQAFRSSQLTQARGQARSVHPAADQFARWHGVMAEAALNDMIGMGLATKQIAGTTSRRGPRGRFVRADETTPFDTARNFEEQYHTVFSRSIAGAAQQPGPFGMRIPPETLLYRAVARQDEMSALQLQELVDAVKFLPDRADMFAEVAEALAKPEVAAKVDANIQLMFSAQERMIRILAHGATKQVVDPKTGVEVTRTNLTGMRRIVDQAKAVGLFEHFPELQVDLEYAVSSEVRLQRWLRKAQGLERRFLGSDSAIGRVLQTDSPSDAVAGALGSTNPITRLDQMLDLARNARKVGMDPDVAAAGLHRAIFEHLLRPGGKVVTADKGVQLGNLVEALDEPLRPGLPSLREWLTMNGLLTAEENARFEQLLKTAERVMVGVTARPVGKEILDPTSPLETLAVRGTGAMAARFLQKTAVPGTQVDTGPTLIISAGGARAAQHLIQHLPNEAVRLIFLDALTGGSVRAGGENILGRFKVGFKEVKGFHPFARVKRGIERAAEGAAVTGEKWSLLNLLLERGGQPKDVLRRYAQLHAYAWQAGYFNLQDVLEGPPEQQPPSAWEQFLGTRRPSTRVAPAPKKETQEQSSAAPGTIRRLSHEGIPSQMTGAIHRLARPPRTRGERNNNPGNIRKSPTAWRGKVEGDDRSFETFATPQDGVRALAKTLLTYQNKHKLNTVQGIISRWAPPNENDTQSYVKSVASRLGVLPTTPLDLTKNPGQLASLTRAIIFHENGRNIYSAKVIREGVAAALEG